MLLKNDAASNDVTSHWADVARSSYAVRLEKLMTCFRLLAGLQGGLTKHEQGRADRHTVEHSISWTPENQTGEKGINSLQPFIVDVVGCCCCAAVLCIYVSATWEKKKRKWSVRKRRKRERKKMRRRAIPREAEVRRRCRSSSYPSSAWLDLDVFFLSFFSSPEEWIDDQWWIELWLDFIP
jgi:hypothetical protein